MNVKVIFAFVNYFFSLRKWVVKETLFVGVGIAGCE